MTTSIQSICEHFKVNKASLISPTQVSPTPDFLFRLVQEIHNCKVIYGRGTGAKILKEAIPTQVILIYM